METWQEWRKKKRLELLACRETVASNDRIQWSMKITSSLEHGFPVLWKSTVGFYWPYRGEYDPRPTMSALLRRGAVLALPEVESERKMLCFRRWWKEAPMKIGAYNIPVTDNTELVMVNAVIVPMLGFDTQGYRLGYGGGYYDRTITEINPSPLVIGVAFEMLRLDNIHPRPHDVAMDFIVTEAGIYQVSKQGISTISTNKCAFENS
jgi:5,10-methenyltetrahydrofolate synthetase